ncbi:MAG: type IV secretion system protein [Alphaproteobacteria bacterium]
MAENSVLVTDNNVKPNLPLSFLGMGREENIPPRRMYYMWLARLFTLLAMVMLVGNVLFSLSLLQIVPQIDVDPLFLLDFKESKDIARIEHANPNIPSKEIVRENFIRLFVESLNTIVEDPGEMVRLLSPGGIVFFLSTPQIYRKYRMDKKGIIKFLEQHSNREVKIVGVKRIGRSAVWQVDFKTYDMQEALMKPIIRNWTASVECIFRKDRRLYTNLLLNPLGFTVTRYAQSEVVTNN